jgi:putative ABC transport system ATP-binding protein
MLELKGVSKTFNVGTANELKALDSLCLTVKDGEFITVVGGNGSGKSTMLNAVAGVFPIDSGSIIIDGVDITNMPAYKRAKYIGRVFQDPMIGSAANMSIEDNLAFASRRGKIRTLKWRITHKERETYREALSQLGLNLENRLTDRVGLLSGGQRQALTLLMATLARPNILLLDEHTAALDPKTAKMVITLSEMLVLKHKMTTLMVTHNMSDALRYGTRVIMMGQGKVVYEAEGEKKDKLTTTEMVEMFSL